MNKLLITVIFLLRVTFLKLVSCEGLNLEFTWTRINYYIPTPTNKSYILLDKPTSKDAIIFPSSLQEYSSSEYSDYLNKNYIYGTYCVFYKIDIDSCHLHYQPKYF